MTNPRITETVVEVDTPFAWRKGAEVNKGLTDRIVEKVRSDHPDSIGNSLPTFHVDEDRAYIEIRVYFWEGDQPTSSEEAVTDTAGSPLSKRQLVERLVDKDQQIRDLEAFLYNINPSDAWGTRAVIDEWRSWMSRRNVREAGQ